MPVDPRRHVYRHEPAVPIEHELARELCGPGTDVLDIGCAATGRSARLARQQGADVVSIEINHAALHEFARRDDAAGIGLVEADMTRLPFHDRAFDVVLIAFHGIDYLLGRAQRRAALREAERVVRPGGALVFNGFNPMGLVLSPRNLCSRPYVAQRIRHLLSLRVLRPTLIDVNGLELRQTLPLRMVREVEAATSFRLHRITNSSGRSSSLVLNTILSSAPYYVFRRTADGADATGASGASDAARR